MENRQIVINCPELGELTEAVRCLSRTIETAGRSIVAQIDNDTTAICSVISDTGNHIAQVMGDQNMDDSCEAAKILAEEINSSIDRVLNRIY